MEVLNKILPLILTAIMSMNLSGCGNSTGANDASIRSDVITQPDMGENEVCLPDGYTMEDLLNGIKINGKSLSYPTTINTILTCDDRFTYELAPIYDDCKTPEEVFDYFHYPYVSFDILCDGHKLFQVGIEEKDYYECGAEKAPVYSFGYGFSSMYFTECDVDFKYLDKLDFNSSYKDIVSCIGKPAYADYSNYFYKFKDNGVEYKLSFHTNNTEFIKGKGNIVSIDFLIKTEDDIDGSV
ncbi:MAG: hypothetical protein K6G68_07780 [Oscillospiraceae bacterium]|nr:hypothetical protein [Oscillospiraceae bacterium]